MSINEQYNASATTTMASRTHREGNGVDLHSSPEVASEPLLDPSSLATSNMNDFEMTNQNETERAERIFPVIHSSTRTTRSFWTAVVVAVLPMFLFGYNTGVLNAPESVMFPGHSTAQWSAAVSSFCVGGMLGSNVSGRAADHYGRRACLLGTGGYLSLLAGLVQFAAPSMSALIVGRMLVGLSGGAATVLVPMYLSEISPPDIRGSVGTATQLACVLGILASVLLAPPFATETQWRILFLPVPAIALVFILLGHWALRESPKWLLLNTNEEQVEEMEEDEQRMTADDHSEPTSTRDDNEDTMMMMVSPSEADGIHNTAAPPRTLYMFLVDPKNRIPVSSSILFPIAQQLSGINAVFYYSTYFFQGVIDNPLVGTMIAFAVNVVATVFAICIMDRFGRKTLLSWSAGGMLACCVFLTLALLKVLPPIITLVAVLVYISFFEIGLGCIPFFLASEMIESEFLGRVQSIAMSANWISNFLVGLCFPYMVKWLGPFSFVPFATCLLATLLFSVYGLVETRGKTQQQVMRELEEARKNWGHHRDDHDAPVAPLVSSHSEGNLV